jgi:ubiquinone/menaquinone biosynthesis C-methylase UbiE
LPEVISEIYRVTKPGGVFFFGTFISKLAAIKIWQEWKSTAFMPPRAQSWVAHTFPTLSDRDGVVRRWSGLELGLWKGKELRWAKTL